MAEETLSFNAEVSRLLELVARSLYSEKQIFLRELISNASDACERLQFLALTEPGLVSDDPDYRITISLDRRTRSLSVADNGIGMTRDELVDNLGTIARSGTAAFVDQVAATSEGSPGLIGQFGVGFYSVFMVGDRVDVLTRRAGA
ncbi:MAG: ATP-binding protein, partial [Chloroflexi bacterium]|nr:ATP-binding protein [Chloroflexota bacterium]